MIENILANLKIERLNPMQEASINAWKEGKDLILLYIFRISSAGIRWGVMDSRFKFPPISTDWQRRA